MYHLDDDTLFLVLKACYLHVRDSGFREFTEVNARIRRTASHPSNVVALFRHRHGAENTAIGLLRHPRFIRNDAVTKLIQNALATSPLPICRLVVEELVDTFANVPAAARFILALVVRSQLWYPDLAVINTFSVMMQLRTVCDGPRPDCSLVANLLSSNNLPTALIFSGDFHFGRDVERAVIVSRASDLSFLEIEGCLSAHLVSADDELIRALSQVFLNFPDRRRAEKILCRLVAGAWHANTLIAAWRIFPQVMQRTSVRPSPELRNLLFHRVMCLPEPGVLRDALNTNLLDPGDLSVSLFCRWRSLGGLDGGCGLEVRVGTLVELTSRGRAFSSRERERLLSSMLRGNLGFLHPLLEALERGNLKFVVPLTAVSQVLATVRMDQRGVQQLWPWVMSDACRLAKLACPPRYGSKAHYRCISELSSSPFFALPEVRNITHPTCAPPKAFV